MSILDLSTIIREDQLVDEEDSVPITKIILTEEAQVSSNKNEGSPVLNEGRVDEEEGQQASFTILFFFFIV